MFVSAVQMHMSQMLEKIEFHWIESKPDLHLAEAEIKSAFRSIYLSDVHQRQWKRTTTESSRAKCIRKLVFDTHYQNRKKKENINAYSSAAANGQRQTENVKKREIENVNHAQDTNNGKMKCSKSVNIFFSFTSLFLFILFAPLSVLDSLAKRNKALDESVVWNSV